MPTNESSLPERSRLITYIQLVEMTSVSPNRLAELIEIGWVEPVTTGGEDYLFRQSEAWRIAKLERICRDFDLGAQAGSIIVDLLARIEKLEREVGELRRLL